MPMHIKAEESYVTGHKGRASLILFIASKADGPLLRGLAFARALRSKGSPSPCRPPRFVPRMGCSGGSTRMRSHGSYMFGSTNTPAKELLGLGLFGLCTCPVSEKARGSLRFSRGTTDSVGGGTCWYNRYQHSGQPFL